LPRPPPGAAAPSGAAAPPAAARRLPLQGRSGNGCAARSWASRFRDTRGVRSSRHDHGPLRHGLKLDRLHSDPFL